MFTHYARSSSKNYALRSLQLVATAQSTIRYAAIAAACDYSTNPDADESVLNWLRQEWLGGKKPSFGTWYGALMRLLAESGKSWKNPFVPEFSVIDRELLEKKIQPLIHSRNVEIGHAEYYEALALKHFVELQEENLFAVMEQFSFLSRYPLSFAEVEDDYEPPSPGTKQAINICRGASHNFARYTVAPSHPLPPGIPFIWNPEYTGILTLSPFLIYGRATTDAEQKERVKGVAHIQGLMVLNGVIKGSPVYTSVDAEAQFSLDSFEFPPKVKIQEQVESAFKKGLDVPARKETRLADEEKELFIRTTDYVTPGFEKEGNQLLKRKPRLNTVLLSAILGVLVLVGFVLYSRFGIVKAPVSEKQRIKSIAILSFKDISPTKDQEYLGDGITNAIIDKLNNIEGLLVKASTSKGKDKSINEIGRELNVEWVLEGSVLKAGNRLQVTARLIRVADQSFAFSKPYNKDFGDIFTILEEISTGVANELKGKLQINEKTALAKRPTQNDESFDLYMRGNKYYGRREYKEGLSCHQRAVELDPNFAQAYVGMAYNYWGLNKIDMRDKMLKHALTIDPNLSEAYILRGATMWGTYDWNGIEREYKRAIELNPGNEKAHREYARFLRYMKRCDEALKENAIAHERNPLYMEIYGEVIANNIILEKYDDALNWFDMGKKVDLNDPYLYRQLGRLYLKQGKYDLAIQSFERQRDIQPTEDAKKWAIHYINLTYAFTGEKGNKDKAEQYLKELLEQKKVSSTSIAMMYAAMGNQDAAMNWLERAYKEHDGTLIGIYSYHEYDPLRSYPRFKALIKKMGFPEEKVVRK